MNFGVCWWWGCLHSADLWSRRRCTSSAPKETEDSRMKGGVRQRKQKKEEEQSKSEVWKFVEVLRVLKMDCHSVVGSGNYWVTFVAQSQFVLIKCLWTLILKAWRPLREGASCSIDGGSEFQVLTYPWGNDRAIVAFERTGRSRESRNETNGSRRAGALFLGCPPVSVGQEAEVGAWLGEDRSAACTEGTGH